MASARNTFLPLFLMNAFTYPGGGLNRAKAKTPEDLNRDSLQGLKILYKANALAERLSHKAKAILIFPNILEAGLGFGCSYGEGVLMSKETVEGYYNFIGGSWGLQAGAESYGYAVFLMTDKAVHYFHETESWEIGLGPTVVLVDEGGAKKLFSSTPRDDAYAFIFSQRGLMAGVSIEGTKISRVVR